MSICKVTQAPHGQMRQLKTDEDKKKAIFGHRSLFLHIYNAPSDQPLPASSLEQHRINFPFSCGSSCVASTETGSFHPRRPGKMLPLRIFQLHRCRDHSSAFPRLRDIPLQRSNSRHNLRCLPLHDDNEQATKYETFAQPKRENDPCHIRAVRAG
jgi:hypothetical protein